MSDREKERRETEREKEAEIKAAASEKQSKINKVDTKNDFHFLLPAL